MKIQAIALTIFLFPVVSWSRGGDDILEPIAEAGAAAETLKDPTLPADQRAQTEKAKEAAVQKAIAAGESHPDAATMLKLGKGLASVEEAPRAIPFAERGLALAEKSGDPKLLRSALLTGSWVYAKAGQYDLARERAERVLKTNPRDKEALALYMEVKDRGAATAPTAKGGSQGGGAGVGQAAAQTGATGASNPSPAPGVAMTSAATREAQRHIEAGWGLMKLDPKAALRLFDQAVAADPQGVAARVARAKAKLAAGDAAGSMQDADAAIALNPQWGEAYAVRGEAKRALGRAEADLLADYETAAKLDGRFTEAYKGLAAKLSGAASAGGTGSGARPSMEGRSAPDRYWGILTHPPKKWGLFALICVFVAAVGGLIAPLVLRKKLRDITSTPTPTPRP